MTSPHKCPGPGCTEQIPHDKLACTRHWYQVSLATRRRVLLSWAQGFGEYSKEHIDAMTQAVREMKR